MFANKPLIYLALLALCAGITPSAQAVEGLTLEIGSSDDDSEMYRLGLRWPWHQWSLSRGWQYESYVEGSLAYWDSTLSEGSSLWDAGLTATFRLNYSDFAGVRPYLEGGIGGHLLSRTHIDPWHNYGSAFQFSSILGLGAAFGERNQYSLGYRMRHMSNARLNHDNDGVNLHEIRFDYKF